MAKLTVFFLILFLAVLSLLAFFNKASVNLTVWKGVTFQDIPLVALLFISAAMGILSMLAITIIRDAKRHVENWQVQRRHKKEEKIMDSYSQGLEAFFTSRYEDASELFARVIESEPEHVHSLLRLGDIAFLSKDLARAEELYMKAREIRPKSIEVLLSLEKVAEAQERWQDAIKFLDNILDIDDQNRMILNMKRDVYERNKKWEEAIEVQNKILKIKLSPEEEKKENYNLLGYKYELGRYFVDTGNTDRAIKILKGIIKTDKGFKAAYLALAEAYLKEKDDKEAQESLLKGFEATASLVFLAKLENLFINMGEPGTIIEIYQKAIQKNRKDIRLQFFLAKLYYRLEMIDYALDTINSIDTASADYPELHALLGSVYERRSEYEMALDEFKKALNVDKPLLIPFCCSHCNHTQQKWSGRCPACKSWNTFVLNINEVCKVQKRQSSS